MLGFRVSKETPAVLGAVVEPVETIPESVLEPGNLSKIFTRVRLPPISTILKLDVGGTFTGCATESSLTVLALSIEYVTGRPEELAADWSAVDRLLSELVISSSLCFFFFFFFFFFLGGSPTSSGGCPGCSGLVSDSASPRLPLTLHSAMMSRSRS
jgi:hypothetical protein